MKRSCREREEMGLRATQKDTHRHRRSRHQPRRGRRGRNQKPKVQGRRKKYRMYSTIQDLGQPQSSEIH